MGQWTATLLLPPCILLPGNNYTLTTQVADARDGRDTLTAETMMFSSPAGPTGGTVTVDPPEGNAGINRSKSDPVIC